MIPYTLDAVNIIRQQISQCTPPESVRLTLGWDREMFLRVCRRHGIEVAPEPKPHDVVSGPSPLEAARADRMALDRARKPVWRNVIVSRLAHRYVSELARMANVPFGDAMGAIAEASLMSGEAEAIELLMKGEVRRDIYCNVKLMPGIENMLVELCKIRKTKPTLLLASIIEQLAMRELESQSVASA